MKDKSLGIWLIGMFGISGLAVIMLAWLWPALESERIMATLTGLVGVAIAAVRALMLRQSAGGNNREQVAVEVEVENKS